MAENVPGIVSAPPSLSAEGTLPLDQFVDILPKVDPKRDAYAGGKWLRYGNAIEDEALNRSGHPTDHLMLPVRVDGDYDLVVTCARLEGQGDVVIVFPVGSTNCLLIGGSNGCHLEGGASFPGTSPKGPVKKEGQPLIVDGVRSTILIKVRTVGQSATIDVLRNNEPYLSWQGSDMLLGVGGYWSPPQPQRPVICAHCSRLAFQSIELRMVSGKASWVAAKRGTGNR
jgi:hypothetical protein